MHAAHGIPCPEGRVRIVHEAVESGRVLGLGAQEEDGELHQLDQSGILEVAPDVVAETAQQLEAGGISKDVQAGEFKGVVGGFVDEAPHADVILDLGLREEVVQLLSGTGLDGLEGLSEGLRPRRHIEGALGKFHPVGRVETNQLVQLVHRPAELGEVAVEHVGHPVPARAHVESEPLGVESARASSGLSVAFEDGHVQAPAGEGGRRSEAGKAGSDDGDIEGGGGVTGHGHDNKQAQAGSCSRV